MTQTDRSAERIDAIRETLSEMAAILDAPGPIDVARMEKAKKPFLALCARDDLFRFEDFPLDPDGGPERTYLIHTEAGDTYALYVNAGRPGQSFRPHDHGGAWAYVGAVTGEETHRLFTRTGASGAPIRHDATITVRPGTAVSLLPDGIHAIAAEGTEPLLHLHLYARTFETIGLRSEFDEETGDVYTFEKAEVGEIVDLRPERAGV